MRWWPITVGVYVTLQVPEASVQLVALKVPVELVTKFTTPDGVPLVEVTVTVHVDATLSRTLTGEQLTVVVVGKVLTPTGRL
jgi:hypothetical protein